MMSGDADAQQNKAHRLNRCLPCAAGFCFRFLLILEKIVSFTWLSLCFFWSLNAGVRADKNDAMKKRKDEM